MAHLSMKDYGRGSCCCRQAQSTVTPLKPLEAPFEALDLSHSVLENHHVLVGVDPLLPNGSLWCFGGSVLLALLVCKL